MTIGRPGAQHVSRQQLESSPAAAAKVGPEPSPDPTREACYSFTASAKWSYTSSALLALVMTSSTGASG